MDFRKVSYNSLMIRASAKISADSVIPYMKMEKETKEFKKQLQERRKNNFLNNKEHAMGFEYQDIDTSNLLISQNQLEKIDRKNCGIWEDIISDCYRTRSTRNLP